MAMNACFQPGADYALFEKDVHLKVEMAMDNEDVDWYEFMNPEVMPRTPPPEDRDTSTPDLTDDTAPESDPEPAEVLTPDPTQRPPRPHLVTTESQLAPKHNPAFLPRQIADDDTTGVSPHDPWAAPASASPAVAGGVWSPTLNDVMARDQLASALPESSPIEPVISKKRPSRTQTNLSAMVSGLHRGGSKRQRHERVEEGLLCEYGCKDKLFYRECDQKKHYDRAHLPESYWPHECIYCDKRSQYPKDVWRHLAQTHHMVVPPKEPKSLRKALGCPCCSKKASDWLAANNTDESAPSSPSTHTSLWTLTRSLLKFKMLSLKAKAGAEKAAFVTLDKDNFKRVDLTGLRDGTNVIRRIASALNVDGRISVHCYSRKSGLGRRLNEESLMRVIADTADAEGTLKLFVASVPADQATNDYFMTPNVDNVFSMFGG